MEWRRFVTYLSNDPRIIGLVGLRYIFCNVKYVNLPLVTTLSHDFTQTSDIIRAQVYYRNSKTIVYEFNAVTRLQTRSF